MENLKSIETDLCTSVITGSQNSPVRSGCGRLARLHRKNNLFPKEGYSRDGLISCDIIGCIYR